jgi:hypothetical protein
MIIEFVSSILLLVISIILIFLTGFLLSLFLIPVKYRNELFWILTPFLGISFTIIVLQTCIYLDIPISLSAFPFLTLVIAGIIVAYSKKKILDIPKLPYILLLLGLVVLAVNGVGYFAVGPSNYMGYAWIDQYNYGATSQFLIDKPFSTSLDQVGNIPYLVEAIIKKDDRIGQSVLQGCIAVLTFTNAQSAYGAISLLSPLLTYFSVWLLSDFVIKDKWFRYGAAVSAACVPGFALIHLQNFLSQALADPFFLISPLIIYYALKEKDWRFVAIGIFILAAIHSIYTEFTLLVIVLEICGGVWYILRTKEVVSSVLIIASITLGGILINVGYIGRSIAVMSQASQPNFLISLFPYSEKVQGLGNLWFGFTGQVLNSPALFFVITFCAVLLTIAAYVGIIGAVRKQKDVICVLLFVIILFPVVILSQSEPYPYQFYKMLMSASPVLVLGVWTLLSDFWDAPFDDSNHSMKDYIHPIVNLGPKIALAGLLISSILITGYLASCSINGGYRSEGYLVNSNDMKVTYSTLENTKNQDYIVSIDQPHELAWVAYHGRNDQIFFMTKKFGDFSLSNISPETFSFNNASQFPQNATKLTIGVEYPQISPNETSNHLIAVIDNPQDSDTTNEIGYNWLASTMHLYLYWQGEKNQNITLSYLSNPGPGDPSSKRSVNISTISGKIQPSRLVETTGETAVSVPLALQPGLNVIEFSAIYPENSSAILSQDAREFLVNISQMKITGNL